MKRDGGTTGPDADATEDGLPDDLRSLFARAGHDDPAPGQMDRLAHRLAVQVGPFDGPRGPSGSARPAPGGAAPPSTGSAVIGGKAAALAGVCVAGAVGLWFATRTAVVVPPAEAPRSVAAAPAAPVVAAPAPIPVAAPEAVAPPAVVGPERVARGGGGTELALMTRARDALVRDPARALALTREHERRFPSGALAEEREVVAIDALIRLGKKEQAYARVFRFEIAFPDSLHRKRLETLMQSK